MFLTIILCWVGILFFESPTSDGPSHLGESLSHSLYQNQSSPTSQALIKIKPMASGFTLLLELVMYSKN
jgi:hypothetical protein